MVNSGAWSLGAAKTGGIKMNILRAAKKPLDACLALACETYTKESAHAGLPPLDKEEIRKELTKLFDEDRVWLATEGDKLLGYLAFGGRYTADDERGSVEIGSPLVGYGIAEGQKRENVYGRLMQQAMREMVKEGVGSFHVSLYAFDEPVLRTAVMSAFVMETSNGIRRIAAPISTKAMPEGYSLRLMTKQDLEAHRADVLSLYALLIQTLEQSPVFYECACFYPLEDRVQEFIDADLKVYGVLKGDTLIGMINTDVSDAPLFEQRADFRSFGDVFLQPAYRGMGLSAALLEKANQGAAADGAVYGVVTHGTVNPTARGFWDKHFTPYAYNLYRRVDARMIGK